MDIYKRIDELIKQSGLSRRAVAIEAGIPPTTLNSAITKGRGLSPDAIEKLAAQLKVSTDYLLKGGYHGTLNLSGLTDDEIIEAGQKLFEIIRRPIPYLEQIQKLYAAVEKYGLTMPEYLKMMEEHDEALAPVFLKYNLTPEQFNNLLEDISDALSKDDTL